MIVNDCDSTDQTCTFKNPVVEECMQQWLMNDVDDVLTSIVVDDWSQKLQNVPFSETYVQNAAHIDLLLYIFSNFSPSLTRSHSSANLYD